MTRTRRAMFALLFLVLKISSVFSSVINTDIQRLEGKIRFLEVRVADLVKHVSVLNQYCSLLGAEVCGPCICRDDPRTPKKYYCDCQHLPAKRDCLEFHQQGAKVDGIYLINQLNLKTIQVFCDQTTDGGGWTIIQRRADGLQNFDRDWDSYKNGFGYLQHEHWLGNQNIHTL